MLDGQIEQVGSDRRYRKKAFVETKKTADVINDFFTKTVTGVASPREQQVSAASW